MAEQDHDLSAEEIVAQAKEAALDGDLLHQAVKNKETKAEEESSGPEEIEESVRNQVFGRAQELIASHEGVRHCMGTMIASRQLYAMAVHDLELQMSSLEGEENVDLLEECLIQAAGVQAAKPFDENALYVGFQETVYPWMVKTVERHNKEEDSEQKREADEWEDARRARRLPVGVKFDPDLEDRLPRDRTLTLVGWRPAVQYVIDLMVTNVLAARDKEQLFHVIRLMKVAKKEEVQRQLLRVTGEIWQNCCRSNKSWPLLFQTDIMSSLSEPPDLLVCDNLCHAAEGVIGGSRLSRAAGTAHKKFREWCLKVGAGFIGGVPLDSKEPTDLSGPEWEQLRTWSCLRPVWVTDSEKTPLYYNIHVGRDLQIGHVPKATLDSHDGNNIILFER